MRVDRSVSVRTPESIAFSYELAGLGSRFLAVTVDMAIQAAILTAIFFGITWAAGQVSVSNKHVSASTSAGVAVLIAIVFMVLFGYFIVFEALWNGQTPGKRLLGVRVVRDGGYPIDAGAAAIRNLVRVGEFSFGFYVLSAISTIVSPLNKRLGDLAAGTIVVRDAPAATLESIVGRAQAPGTQFDAVPEQDRVLVERFLMRRSSMGRSTRANLAMRLAERVRPHVAPDLRRLDDETLLERVSGS